MDGRVSYVFQPRGLNKETCLPIKKIEISVSRLAGINDKHWEEIDFALDVLGTEVEDTGIVFRGMAIMIVRHTSGCMHVEIQPSGLNPTTNEPIRQIELDLRQCKGKKVPTLTATEHQESLQKKPSPTGDDMSSMRKQYE